MSTTQLEIFYWPNGCWYSPDYDYEYTDIDQYRDSLGLSDDYATVKIPNTFTIDRIDKLVNDINNGIS